MKEIKILRITLIIYIILCLIIAGLNYGVPESNVELKHTINKLWHFFENGYKLIMMGFASWLTFRILRKEKSYKHRKSNIIALMISGLVLHLVLPLLTGNYEIYFFSMPVPFNTTGLKLVNTASEFYQAKLPIWGSMGIAVALIVTLIYFIVIYSMTYIFGRKFNCSMLCMFNGFIAEVFSPIFSVKKKKAFKFLRTFKIIFFIIAICFIVFSLVTAIINRTYPLVEMLEVYKYLIGELMMAMFLWIAFTGRGYCYYCPLGTSLGYVAQLGGQEILTDLNQCISCGKCNDACQMSIDIKGFASQSLPVKDLNCVGCGHCIDVCPVNTLAYSTKFMKKHL